MTYTLAFDVYGTLIDTQGVTNKLHSYLGDLAAQFAQQWRDKQLEYAFRRGLMEDYVNFSDCIQQALEYTCQHFDVYLSTEQKNVLLECYLSLPAFEDVAPGLSALAETNHQLFAFSNGTTEAVESLLSHSELDSFFSEIVTVETTKTFKPSPKVYQHLLHTTQSSADATWLVSSNPFDIIGAASQGLQTAWIKRSEKAVFDPWGVEPTLIVENIVALSEALAQQ
ncbi:haloacid dehalogenase type II [Halioxenophilus aromaticivorans]|uniref:(S)-2-haloacid dehalogenase n=1 Tax=Halioxenophilus aromaticivorans TaxID=1306992 RepID=A0AAV3TXI9_9ALTE